jgi:ubiquinone/menaquinone biosynthesis C-methylase UbiE
MAKQFTKKEQYTFWSKNTESFKGDIISVIILNLTKKYIGRSVLDAGAGSGSLLLKLRELLKDRKIIGIDLAPKHKLVQKGDCTNLKFKDKEFDTYISTDVIEHLGDKDLNKCISEANRVLKVNGYAIFSTLNNENLDKNEVICPECGSRFHRWGHCQLFTVKRIKELFSKKGFTIEYIKITNLVFLVKYGFIAKLFYLMRLNKVIKKVENLNNDILFVVQKSHDIK